MARRPKRQPTRSARFGLDPQSGRYLGLGELPVVLDDNTFSSNPERNVPKMTPHHVVVAGESNRQLALGLELGEIWMVPVVLIKHGSAVSKSDSSGLREPKGFDPG